MVVRNTLRENTVRGIYLQDKGRQILELFNQGPFKIPGWNSDIFLVKTQVPMKYMILDANHFSAPVSIIAFMFYMVQIVPISQGLCQDNIYSLLAQ